jgi:hypothetical protein
MRWQSLNSLHTAGCYAQLPWMILWISLVSNHRDHISRGIPAPDQILIRAIQKHSKLLYCLTLPAQAGVKAGNRREKVFMHNARA